MAVLSLICAEVTIFMILYAGQEGEINIAGYFRKNLDARLFWLPVFFIIIGIVRLLFVLMVGETNKVIVKIDKDAA